MASSDASSSSSTEEEDPLFVSNLDRRQSVAEFTRRPTVSRTSSVKSIGSNVYDTPRDTEAPKAEPAKSHATTSDTEKSEKSDKEEKPEKDNATKPAEKPVEKPAEKSEENTDNDITVKPEKKPAMTITKDESKTNFEADSPATMVTIDIEPSNPKKKVSSKDSSSSSSTDSDWGEPPAKTTDNKKNTPKDNNNQKNQPKATQKQTPGATDQPKKRSRGKTFDAWFFACIGIVAAIGIGLMIYFAIDMSSVDSQKKFYSKADCLILEKKLLTKPSDVNAVIGALTVNYTLVEGSGSGKADIKEDATTDYGDKSKADKFLSRFQINTSTKCFINNEDPTKGVERRGIGGGLIIGMVFALLLLGAVGGAVGWWVKGTSTT